MSKRQSHSKKQSVVASNILLILVSVFTVLFAAVEIFLFVKVMRYGEISINIVLAVGLVLLAMLLIMIVFLLSSFIYRNNMAVKIVNLMLVILLTVGCSYAGYLLSSINKTIDDLIQVDETVDEMVTAYFIAFDKSNAKDAGISYLEGKTVGILDNEEILEGHVMPIEEIKKQGVSVTYEEYETYQELLFALFAGKIDVAAVAPSYASSFTEDDGQTDNLKKITVVHTYEDVASVTTKTNTNIDLTEPFTVLVIGVDSMNSGNSDVLMLASFNPNTLDITLTSIARDSFVPISCYGGSLNKINAARTSRQCLIDTVENLMDIEINFYFETNFDGVVDIVDALGGIVINSEVEFVGQNSSLERGNYTVWIPQGEYHANGEEVLAFIRERHAFADGDFARQRHQQQVIRTILDKVLKMNDLNSILGILDAAGKNISTNMSLSQIQELLTYCLRVYNTNYDNNSLIFDIQTSRVTGYSSWTYNTKLEMRLWIYKLFNGSIKDNAEFIRNNLELEKNLSIPASLNLYLTDIYRVGKSVPTYYAEAQEHEKMPDFVESFVGKTLDEMEEWAKQHGLTLNITFVEDGDEGYDEKLEDRTILSQNITSGRVALVSSLDIRVIKHPLDCSLSENQNSQECANTYINAVSKDIDTVIAWAKEKGITLSFNVITSKDESYDVTKAGYVKTQTEKAYSQFNESKTLGVTYYEKLTITLLDELATEIKDGVKQLVYNKTMSSPTYTCADPEYIFKGWTDLATGNLFDFSQKITSDLKLQAYCVAPVKYKVTFVYETDHGSTTSEVIVISGQKANAPDAAKTGFTYTWDVDFSNVTSDLTVTAIYTLAPTPEPTIEPTPLPSTEPTPESTPETTEEPVQEPETTSTPE